MKNLNPQAEKIYYLLQDLAWHCPIDWGYSDGHGKRLTDINRFLAPRGQKLAYDWCDCGRHTAKLKKRKIVPISAYEKMNTMADRQDKLLYEAEDRRRFTQFTGMTSQEFLLKYPSQPIKQENTLF
jgi:hypothetical protein